MQNLIRVFTISFLFACMVVNLVFFNQVEETALNQMTFDGLMLFSAASLCIIIVLVWIYSKRFVTLHLILLFFIFLFLYGRVFVYVLDHDLYNFTTFQWVTSDFLGQQVMTESVLYSNMMVLCIVLVLVLWPGYHKIAKNNYEAFQRTSQTDHIRLMTVLCYITGGLLMFKLLLEVRYIITYGYLALYTGGLSEVNYYSPIIKNSHYLFFGCFYYFLCLKPGRKQFIILALLYIILSLTNALKGARILFILPVFYILWFYFQFYTSRIKPKTIAYLSVFLVLLIGFSIYLKNSRLSQEVNLERPLIYEILNETGRTLQVAGMANKYQNSIKRDYPYVLEPILYPYFYFKYYGIITKGQSEDMIKVRNSLNHQLTYYVNSSYYLLGNGLGSSTVAELMIEGPLVLIFVSLIIGVLIILLLKNLDKPLILFLSPMLVQHIFFIPRESPFPNLIGVFKYVIIYYLIKLAMGTYQILVKKPTGSEIRTSTIQ